MCFCRKFLKKFVNWKKRSEEWKNNRKKQRGSKEKLQFVYNKEKQKKNVEKKNCWKVKLNEYRRFMLV